jgi:hypothetical protein
MRKSDEFGNLGIRELEDVQRIVERQLRDGTVRLGV